MAELPGREKRLPGHDAPRRSASTATSSARSRLSSPRTAAGIVGRQRLGHGAFAPFVSSCAPVDDDDADGEHADAAPFRRQ